MNLLLAANCWTWDVDPTLIPIWGPIQIRWYGLCFLVVFVTGYYFYDWQFRRGGFDDEMASRYVNMGVLSVLLGAWLGHRFFYDFDRVLANPLYLIDIRRGLVGLASHGAAVGLAISLYWFAKREKVPVYQTYDRFAWSACMGLIFVRLGNLFNSEIIGRPTDVDWAVCLPRVDSVPIPRHPSQIYESLMGLTILGILFALDKLFGGEKRPPWLMSSVWLMCFGVFRFILEYFKAHQTLDPTATLTMGQYLSIPIFLGGLGIATYAILKWRKEQRAEHEN
jgi:prolipoprotein diacylglyceryl transferase